MRAAVFEQAGKPMAIKDVETPRPGPGELLIRVHRCGICGSDLHMTDPHSCFNPASGTVIGHEFAGEVVALGEGTQETWREGHRLSALPYMGCGHCAACLTGDTTQCPNVRSFSGPGGPTGFAEYSLVTALDSVRLHDGLSWEEGAFVEPVAVGIHAVAKSGLRQGARVLILGAGPVGLAVAVCARAAGAASVVVSARSEHWADRAVAMGATDYIQADEKLAENFARHAGGPPEFVFECVGSPGMLGRCAELCAPRGTVVMAGACMQQESFMPIGATMKELTVQFAVCYHRDEFRLAEDLIASGRIDPMPMFDGLVSLEDFPATFESLRTDKHACKLMLTM